MSSEDVCILARPVAKCCIMQIHASCAARDGAAVLLVGTPGCGKSDLLLRLLDHGFSLVADDQVCIEHGVARPPTALAGLIEVRGLGITCLRYVSGVPLKLVARLAPHQQVARLPFPRIDADLGLPVVAIDPWHVSAAQRVALALDCCVGRATQVAGAFAA